MYYPGEWLNITDATPADYPFRQLGLKWTTSTLLLDQKDLQLGTPTLKECSVIKKVSKFFARLATKLKLNKKKRNDYQT